jgi:hypothetical protein
VISRINNLKDGSIKLPSVLLLLLLALITLIAYSMVPPRRFSNISESGDISHTSYPKRQRMDKTLKNAHFDQMIQSMSAAVNRDRRQPKGSYDAYSPSRSTTVASELSFIKRTDTRRSSSASKVFPEHVGTNATKS